MKTRTIWAPLCVKFVCRFEVEIPENYVEAAPFAPPHQLCVALRCTAAFLGSVVLMVNAKLINSVLVLLPASRQACSNDTGFTVGSLLIKK